MDDYRYKQIAELDLKIEETKLLLQDPQMAQLAQKEIEDLEEQKKVIQDSMVEEDASESLDQRNVIFELKGATGGEEAKLWAEELLHMYTRFAQLKGFKVER
jgi:peptide chain release factor 1